MKIMSLFFVLFVSFGMLAQEVNTQKGFAAAGYDVVSYFNGKATKGKSVYTKTYKGVTYKFSNKENLTRFNSNPSKFEPQYGGYCAYAIATSEKKVSINPKSFKIQNGKLYLFEDTVFADTLEKWNEEGPEKLEIKADSNWEKIAMKKN